MGNKHLGNKAIMIFGAGINQLELIKAARMMNVMSIVLDPAINPPGKQFADFFYRVEGTDYETTKSIALKHKVNGIVTGQMEKPMRLMARLAQELNFIFHSLEVTEKSLDKWLMKKAFIEHKVPCAKGILIRRDEEISEKLLKDISYPSIIKPRDATSSQGVFRINNFNELIKYKPIAQSFSKNGEIIIEEFLEGSEFSVETITYNGLTTVIQFTEKFITSFPQTVEMGHLQPANLTDDNKKSISKIVIQAINAISSDNSAAHTELKLTDEGPKIIEIGARLGGDFISSYLTLYSCGINMDKAAISVALGQSPDLQGSQNCFSYIRYLELPEGKIIKELLPLDDLRKLPGVVFAWIFAKTGDVILPIVHSAVRPACILVKADSREDVIVIADRYINELKKLIITN